MKLGHLLAVGAVLGALAVMLFSSRAASGTIGSSPPAPSESITVSGSVVATAPDGGLRVSLGSDTVSANVVGTVPVSGTVGVSGTIPVSGTVSANVVGTVPVSGTVSTNVIGTVPVSGSVSANVVGTVPVSGAVTATVTGGVIAYPPDGGAQVTLAGERVEVSATTPPGTWLAVAGDITGTVLRVTLDTTSLASIGASTAERQCVYGDPGPPDALFTATPVTIPPAPLVALSNRTAVSVINNATAIGDVLWCRVNGVPSATNAIPVRSLATLKLTMSPSAVVNCRCKTGTCAATYLEERCSAPAP